MNNVLTAEEFLSLRGCEQGDGEWNLVTTEDLREFARLHVQKALEEADKQAQVTPIDHEEISEGSFRPIWGVDSSSILNAYPLENIK